MSDVTASQVGTVGARDAILGAPRPLGRSGADVADYMALLKPRVMSLVVFTGFAGVMVAPGGLHPLLAAVAVFCIAVGAGAAGAINMWYDRDIDAVMDRTRRRPIPTGRVAPEEALAFGTVLSLLSVLLMALAVNYTAAALLALAIGFYVFIYTIWLKRRTPQNIVIGGAAGAFPPMIGWAAVTGSVSLDSIVLFLLIFFWTPPHFWALALYRNGDYSKAGVPMLPVVAGATATKRQIVAYAAILLPIGLAPTLLGTAGPVYGAVAAVMGALFLALCLKLQRAGSNQGSSDRIAKQTFGFSILYLFVLFAVLIVDRSPGLIQWSGGLGGVFW